MRRVIKAYTLHRHPVLNRWSCHWTFGADYQASLLEGVEEILGTELIHSTTRHEDHNAVSGTMTEVLTIQTQPEGAFGSGSLRRSTSQSSCLHQAPSSYSRASPNVRSAPYIYDLRIPPSVPSSAPSSPRLQQPDFSNQPSYTSTPSSSLSLDEDCDPEQDDILFPSYGDNLLHNARGTLEPPPSPDLYPTEDPPTTPNRTGKELPNLDPFERPQVAGDDTAIRVEPSGHVDYLSHTWKEEDIWSSWRHIVAKRNVHDNGPRLENASWRTWAKSKNRLKTISPDTLNW